jgi:ribosome-associated heat shock protein Hsp15
MSRGEETPAERVRLDRWLWAARFFKTRALASEAVDGGKVHLNGERVKAAHVVRPGDRLEIRRGLERLEVVVKALAEQRGPAAVAQQLYEETAASRAQREAEAERRRLTMPTPRPSGRPDKRSRRQIIRFSRGQS